MADNGEPRHCARSGGFHLRRFAAPFGGTIAKPLSYGQVDGFVRNPTSPAARHYTTSCPPPPSRCCAVPRPTTPSTRPPRHTPLAGGHLHVLYDVVLPSHASSRRRPASGPSPRLSNIRIRCCAATPFLVQRRPPSVRHAAPGQRGPPPRRLQRRPLIGRCQPPSAGFKR